MKAIKNYFIIIGLLYCIFLGKTYAQRNAVGSSGFSTSKPTIQSTYTFSGGDGSAGNPFLISNKTDLDSLSSNPAYWTDNFEQTANITFSSSDFQSGGEFYNGGAGFNPIGNSTNKFFGSYHGNGYTIDSLYINRGSTDYVGLFGYLSGGLISNLGIENESITGSQYVGGLVGLSQSSTVLNCYSSGLVGGSQYVGGLVGINNSSLSNSYSTASVSGSQYIGGLVGINNSSLSNSYSIGSVSGSSEVGGLVGNNSSTVSNSFWDTQASNQSTSAGGIGEPTDSMKTESTFTSRGWDFTNTWSMDTTNQNVNKGYPFLYWQEKLISGSTQKAGVTLAWTDTTAKSIVSNSYGNYTIGVSNNWAGTVTPSLTGYTFSPSNRTYKADTSNQTGQNYTILLTISGNAGIAGATLSWTDTTAKTVTADGSGNYSITVSYNWSGTVTPSLTGYTFSPSNRTYKADTSNQTGQNYTAAVATYTISGNAGIGGAILSWTDTTAKTVTADGSGNYSITVSYNWSGIITPSNIPNYYNFSPSSKSYKSLTANQSGQNYTATLPAPSGSGTVSDPYQISNLENLYWLSRTASLWGNGYYFKQTADINADSTKLWNGGIGFTAIANPSSKFIGTYDGSGHIITGLYTNYPTGVGPGGMFRATDTSTVIKNLGLDSAYISYTINYVGGLVGENSGHISNCYFAGSVNGSSYVGGLVGINIGHISNCHSTGSVNGTQNVGGLFGYGVVDNLISNCYSRDSVSGNSNVGGLFGYIFSGINSPTISNCNYTGSVKATGNYAGGLIGELSAYISITSCTVSATVNSEGSGIGGLIGYIIRGGNITSCTTSGSVKTTGDGAGGLIGSALPVNITSCTSSDSVSGNLYVGGLTGADNGSSYKYSSSTGSVVGDSHVGGFIGYFDVTSGIGPIISCFSSSHVVGTSNVGGFAGYTSLGSITNCYALGTVSGSTLVGGLIGYTFGTPVENCYSTGLVSGSSQVGGFIGYNGYIVSNCFWNTDSAGTTGIGSGTTAGATGEPTDSMKTESTFTSRGWDFVGETKNGIHNYWDIDPTGSYNNGYLYFPWQQGLVTISGNAEAIGVTLTWSDSSKTKTITSNNRGNYSITVSHNWSGTITPSLTGLSFSPSNRTYANLSSNQTSQNYNLIYAFSGDGSAGNPYLISNKTDLYVLSLSPVLWVKNFKQTANITFSSSDFQSGGEFYNGGAGFNPIGNDSTAFAGSYNGNGYTIDSIYINRGSSNYVGLFGYLSYGLISNLGIENGNITGSQNVGGLLGYVQSSVVENCYSTGSVNGNTYVGGLVGNNNSPLSNSYSTATVSGSSNVGGLIGNNEGTVNNCYSIGGVTGSSSVGGFAGNNSSTVSNSFWDITSSGQDTSAGGIGEPDDSMKTELTFTSHGWDFVGETKNGINNYWDIDPTGSYNNGYPYLSWQLGLVTISGNAEAIGVTFTWSDSSKTKTITSNSSGNYSVTVSHNWSGTITPSFAGLSFSPTNRTYTNVLSNQTGQNYSLIYAFSGGDGSAGNPYLISNKTDLLVLSSDPVYWTDNFKQTANITFSSSDFQSGGEFYNGGAGFISIGNYTIQFTGSYNGGGYAIDSLYISRSSADTVGLFGYIYGGSVSNLGIENENITGNQNVGGLVGFLNTSTVENCYSTGHVSGSNIVGGLVGHNFVSTVIYSYSADSVSSGSYIGCLVGENDGSTLSKSYSIGSVSGSSQVGGLVGYNNSTIINSYSTAKVIGSGSEVGGLVGYYETNTSNSFWDTTSSGQNVSAGGIGEPDDSMKTESTFTSRGWDFTSTWSISPDTNNGYPYLQSVAAPLPVELTTFTASTNGNTVILNWNTATEVNCYGFDIERSRKTEVSSQSSTVNRHSASPSLNGHSLSSDWEKIGFVKGVGNSNSPKSYSFIDKSPVAGKAEYRLKQIDNDGSFKYSKIVGASFMKPTAFTLYQNYPNPFNPSTNLKYNLPYTSHVMLTIYNTLGQRVKVLIDKIQSAGYYNYQWNANEMASGVYICVLDAKSTNGKSNYQSIKKMVLLK